MKKTACCFMLMISMVVMGESIVVKPVRKESTNKMKQQLAHDFDELIQLSTTSIRDLSGLIDEMVEGVKQLLGEHEGVLASSDKKVLQSYGEKANELKNMLNGIHSKCTFNMHECKK